MQNSWFQQHILRHTRNVRLHPLHKIALGGLVILVGISFTASNVTTIVNDRLDLILSAVLPGVVVDLTNQERAAQNLGALQRNTTLDEAARLKAEHMKALDYFAHYSPEGVSPWFWFEQAEYDYVHAGENLAVYFDETEDVVDAWMDSPLHRDNILKKEYTEIGVAAVKGEHDGYSTVFVVQLFGTPAAAVQPAPTPSPVATEPVLTLNTEEPAEDEPVISVQGDATTTDEVQGEENVVYIEEAQETEGLLVVEDLEPKEEPTSLVRRVQMDENIVYVSDHLSTSTGKVAGPVAPITSVSENNVAPRGGVPTKTARVLETLYTLLAALVTGVILVSIVLSEKRLQHVQAVYGVFLLIVTVALVTVHTQVVAAAPLF